MYNLYIIISTLRGRLEYLLCQSVIRKNTEAPFKEEEKAVMLLLLNAFANSKMPFIFFGPLQ